jgi:alpha-glucosidase
LARRHGNDWYVAGINAAGDKEISLSLDFLRKGNYKIEMYSDDSNDPLSSIKIEEMNIDSSKKLKLKLIENGGFCTIFKDSSR